jgi:S1-C subfamily serine protease
MRVDYLTGFWEPRFVLLGAEGPCVAVSDVESESPAAKAGLSRGTKIRRVGNTRVETPDDFRRAIVGKQGPVDLTIIIGLSDSKTVTVEGESP